MVLGSTRDRTDMFRQYRNALRTHKRGPRTATELKDFKVEKNLLASPSDDEGSTMDARAYSVPPVWVSLVDDMNRDISQIKIKSAPAPTPHQRATHRAILCPLCVCIAHSLSCADARREKKNAGGGA